MDTTTWSGNQADANVEGRNIGTLAVIAPLLQRMNVAEIIDQHLPADPQAEFNYDPTHILFHGAYGDSLPRNELPADATIPIVTVELEPKRACVV